MAEPEKKPWCYSFIYIFIGSEVIFLIIIVLGDYSILLDYPTSTTKYEFAKSSQSGTIALPKSSCVLEKKRE